MRRLKVSRKRLNNQNLKSDCFCLLFYTYFIGKILLGSAGPAKTETNSHIINILIGIINVIFVCDETVIKGGSTK
jgi:hypothetical protein